MSKEPKIKHEYKHHKDKMKITISGYSLSKTTRSEIIDNLIKQVESSPNRLRNNARTLRRKTGKKNARGQQKVTRLEEVGD